MAKFLVEMRQLAFRVKIGVKERRCDDAKTRQHERRESGVVAKRSQGAVSDLHQHARHVIRSHVLLDLSV